MARSLALVLAFLLVIASFAVAKPAGTTVWLSPVKGTNKYHRQGCHALRGKPVAVGKAEALKRGCKPCRLCRPDQALRHTDQALRHTALARTATLKNAPAKHQTVKHQGAKHQPARQQAAEHRTAKNRAAAPAAARHSGT